MDDDAAKPEAFDHESDLAEAESRQLGPPPTHGETGAREASVAGESHPVKLGNA
jgi:hypothetical protein